MCDRKVRKVVFEVVLRAHVQGQDGMYGTEL